MVFFNSGKTVMNHVLFNAGVRWFHPYCKPLLEYNSVRKGPYTIVSLPGGATLYQKYNWDCPGLLEKDPFSDFLSARKHLYF